MADHHFSDKVVNAFEEIGDYDFLNPVDNQPWSTRSRVIAKQRIYEKYLLPQDIFKAVWHQRKARNSKGANFETPYYWGQQYIKEILNQRSKGNWKEEMANLIQSLPSVTDYAMQFYGITEQDIKDIEHPAPKLKIVR